MPNDLRVNAIFEQYSEAEIQQFLMQNQNLAPTQENASTASTNSNHHLSGYDAPLYTANDDSAAFALQHMQDLNRTQPTSAEDHFQTFPVDVSNNNQLISQAQVALSRYFPGAYTQEDELASNTSTTHTQSWHYSVSTPTIDTLHSHSVLPIQTTSSITPSSSNLGASPALLITPNPQLPLLQPIAFDYSLQPAASTTVIDHLPLGYTQQSHDATPATIPGYILNPTESLVPASVFSNWENTGTSVQSGGLSRLQGWHETPASGQSGPSSTTGRRTTSSSSISPKRAISPKKSLSPKKSPSPKKPISPKKEIFPRRSASPTKVDPLVKAFLNSPEKQVKLVKMGENIPKPVGSVRANWCRCKSRF